MGVAVAPSGGKPGRAPDGGPYPGPPGPENAFIGGALPSREGGSDAPELAY